MSTAPSLVLADDSALLREGLAGLLERQATTSSPGRAVHRLSSSASTTWVARDTYPML